MFTLTWAQACKKAERGNVVQADYMNNRWGVVCEEGRYYCYNPTLGGKYEFTADARARSAKWRVMR